MSSRFDSARGRSHRSGRARSRALRLVVVVALMVGGTSTIRRTATAAGEPPANDNFANAMVVVDQALYSHQMIGSSTVESGPTGDRSSAPTTGTVWFKLVTPTAGEIRLDVDVDYSSVGPKPDISGSALFFGSVGATDPSTLTETFNGERTEAGVGVWLRVDTIDTSSRGFVYVKMWVDPDTDGDGILDRSDNCIGVDNQDQLDTNEGGRVAGNGYGDVCEPVAVPLNDRFANAQAIAVDQVVQGTLNRATVSADPADNYDSATEVSSVWFVAPVPAAQIQCVNTSPTATIRTDLSTGTQTFISVSSAATGPLASDAFRLTVTTRGGTCSGSNDDDWDGKINTGDNCQRDYNPSQDDVDADGIGDACDFPAEPPANDNAADALPITVGGSLSVQGSTFGATPDNGVSGQSVWYKFTAVRTAWYEARVVSNNPGLNPPVPLVMSAANNQQRSVTVESSEQYRFVAFEGEDVRVAMATPYDVDFSIDVTVGPLLDTRMSMPTITDPIRIRSSTGGATTEPGEPPVGGAGPSRTVWQRVRFTGGGNLTISPQGFSLDPAGQVIADPPRTGVRIALRRGSTEVASSDGTGSALGPVSIDRCVEYDVVFDSQVPQGTPFYADFSNSGGVGVPCSLVAVSDGVSVPENSTLGNSVDVAANDTDALNRDRVYSLLTNGMKGTATCTAPGICTYVPTAGSTGNDTFAYNVITSDGDSASASVDVQIVPATLAIDMGPQDPVPTLLQRPWFRFGFAPLDRPDVPLQCAVDANAFVPCVRYFQTDPLTNGAHVFRVRAGSSEVTRSFTKIESDPNDPPANWLPGTEPDAPTLNPGSITINLDRQNRVYWNEWRLGPNGTRMSICPAALVQCFGALQLAFDSGGNAFFLLSGDLAKLTPAGSLTTLASVGAFYGVAVDASNNVFVGQSGKILRITPSGVVSTFVSNPAVLVNLEQFAFDSQGNLWASNGQRATKITPTGMMSSIEMPGLIDGIAVDGDNNVYAAGEALFRVRASGGPVDIISAPSSASEHGGVGPCDGRPISKTFLGGIHHVAADSVGNLYVNQVTSVCQVEGLLKQPPIAEPDSLTVAQNSAAGATVNVALNDSAPEGGGPMTFAVASQGTKGTASCTSVGVCTYVPMIGQLGADSFTYMVTDSGARTATGTVTVTITSDTDVSGSFMPVAPVRLLDTRPTPLAPGGVRTVQVRGVAGVPIGATAVSLNVAAVEPAHAGHLRVYPSSGSIPTASVLNFGAGKNTPNHVVVPIGADGSVSVYAGDTTNVIVDINGYFVGDDSLEQYVPVVTPTRIQVPAVLPAARVGPTPAGAAVSSTNVQVLGVGGIPATGVSAVLVNVGALDPAAAGHLRVYTAGDPLPDSSTHNFAAGDSRMNLVIVRPSASGEITVYNASSGPVTITVDTVGYFQNGGLGFKPVSPIRAIDTRELTFGDGNPVVPGGFREVQIRGFAGIPESAKTVIINVAAVNPLGSGSIDVGPSGSNPVLPSFTHPAGENVANLVVVPIGADGKVRIVNNSAATSHVIADITGYFRE
jgi:hypothetical protein